MHKNDPVIVEAILHKVTTLVDGGIRVSFDLTEKAVDSMSQLYQLRDENLYLVVMTEKQYREHRG